ncbi:MAG: hypothetical protein NC254_11100 [bacterium]|nr:hypothetical protein [bacterium]
MSVFRYEWSKLCRKKLFLLITLLLFAGNLLNVYAYEKNTTVFFYVYEQKESYQEYLAGNQEADTDGYYRQDREQQESYIASYPSFIGEMQDRAARMMGTAIYAEPESYVYRNLVKSCVDFAPLSEVVPQADNCFGIRELAEYHNGLLFVLVFLAVLGYYVLFYERDRNLLLLIKGSRNGHMPLAAAKLAVMVLSALFYTALQECASILLFGWMYGYGNLCRAVQSVSLFRNCAYPLTVAEALCSIVWIRMGIAAVIACLLYGLGMLFKSAPFVCMVFGGTLLAEYFFSRRFSISGTFGGLKCINPFYCWNMKWVLGEYFNLNLFGHPAGKNICAVVAAVLMGILFAAVGLLAFCKTCQIKKEGRLERIMRALRGRTAFLNRRISLLYYEFYKMLVQQKKGIVCLVLLAWCVSESAAVSEAQHYASAKTASYHYYIDRLGGRITEETILFMEQEEAFFVEVRKGPGGAFASEDPLRMQELIARADMLEDGFRMVKDQLEALKEKPGNLWDKYLLDEVFYKELWQDTGTDLTLWFIGAAVLLYLVCGIGTVDEKKNMNFLIRSTLGGRERIERSRNLCAYLCAGVLFVLTELPLFLRYERVDHFTAAAQRVCDFTSVHLASGIPLGGMIALIFLLKALSLAAVCFAGRKLSRLMKSEMPAMLTGIGAAGIIAFTLHHFGTDIATLLMGMKG